MRSVLFGLNVFIGAGLLILSSSAMAEDCNLPTCKNKAGYYQDASKEVQKQQTLKDQPVQAVKDLKSEKENKTENNPAIVKSQFPKLGATPVAQGTPPCSIFGISGKTAYRETDNGCNSARAATQKSAKGFSC